MSDIRINWYGNAGPEDNLSHNYMAISIVEAITEASKGWAVMKADAGGVSPEVMKGLSGGLPK